MRNPGLILAAAFALSLAGAAAWPATEWAAQNDAERIAAEQCRKNGLSCETEARPRRPKDECGASTVGSRPSPHHLAALGQ